MEIKNTILPSGDYKFTLTIPRDEFMVGFDYQRALEEAVKLNADSEIRYETICVPRNPYGTSIQLLKNDLQNMADDWKIIDKVVSEEYIGDSPDILFFKP